ncbi:transcriptional regulator [Marinobacter salarius]|jgi:DNA-binding transcriptional regulator YdaS (Cro superfamily)|uniref:transcriptional regulator n=2 Tax=Marinobacter salarius TaxID=1420917 RepID=UPI0034DD746C
MNYVETVMAKSALERAIEIKGGQTPLAAACGITQPYVWNWLNRDGRVPAEYALSVCRAVDFGVRPHDLRPDIYPNPNDCVPDQYRSANAA